MTQRHIHYEAAFEDYLRSQGTPYVPVDEQKKVIFSGARVKSFDFLVYREYGEKWIVDVKGRKYPYDTDANRRCWENWVTRDDLVGLASWQEAFGEGFIGVFVFAYWLTDDDPVRQPTRHTHTFGEQRYAFLCVTLDEYRDNCRPRSGKWDTVTLPTAIFRQLARPIQEEGGLRATEQAYNTMIDREAGEGSRRGNQRG
jgi:hypothetical protein